MPTAGQITGLVSSSDGGDTLTITQGVARDSTDSAWITVPDGETRTVDITASGLGGLDTGSVAASTSYALYIVEGPAGAVGGILSLSFTESGVTILSGSVLRRIGAVVTDSSSEILKFTMEGTSNARAVTYDVAESTVQIVDGSSATVWTEATPQPWLPVCATKGKLKVVPSGTGNTSSVMGEGAPVTVGTATVLPLTPSSTNRRYDFKNDGTGTTDLYVLGFFDTL